MSCAGVGYFKLKGVPMVDPELVEYRRVLARLLHGDDVQERTYLLESDRAEIEAVMDQNDNRSHRTKAEVDRERGI